MVIGLLTQMLYLIYFIVLKNLLERAPFSTLVQHYTVVGVKHLQSQQRAPKHTIDFTSATTVVYMR